MKGSIVARTLKDGSKRYDAAWRANGKQRWKTFHRRKDAEVFLTETVRSVHNGTYRDPRPLPMGEVLDRWLSDWLELNQKLGKPKPSSARTYRNIVEHHFRPAFQAYRSDQLGGEAVAAWVRGLADRVAQGTLTPKTFNNVITLCRMILTWARHPQRRYLQHDPLEETKRLPKQRVERDYLEPHELKALLEAAAETPPDDTILKVAAFTGLRRGELFGLQWGDVEWNRDGSGGRIYVRRSVYMGKITTPKTQHSIRVVDVPQRLLDELTVYKAMYPPQEGDFLFPNSLGGPMGSDNWFKRRFLPIVERAGLRRIGLHTLRHTYTSMLINAGENVKYISRQLGHSSVQLTVDLYSHVFKETSSAAMRRLDLLMAAPASNGHLTEQAKTPENTKDYRGTVKPVTA